MVMNKKKQVFGVVENVEENKDYTGVKTKTANVTVDNTSREISVDVDFSSMLGETNQTAYPGHLGAQTRRFVLKAMDEVSSETARAMEAEERLEELIADTAWDIALGDSEVKSKLYDEINRSKLAEIQLQLNIDNLDKATDSKFNNIQNSIVNLSEEVTKQDNLIKEDLAESKTDLLQTIDRTNTQLSKRIDTEVLELHSKIDDTSTNLETEFNAQLSELDNTVQSNFDELQSKIQDSNIQNQESITKLQADVQQALEDVIQHSDSADNELDSKIIQLQQDVQKSDESLQDNINTLSSYVNTENKRIDDTIDLVKEEYAEKTYVYEKLVEFTKLSKQVVDYVDEKNNVVIIDGSIVTPVDGIIYLVKDSSADVTDVYREYTTIDGLLTLIGDTSTNLDGYATEKWVQDQCYVTESNAQSTYASITYVDEKSSALEEYIHKTVDAIDLTPYAKKDELPTKLSQFENDADYATKSDIPDVSSFIAEIPEEYVTEEELNAKGYFSKTDVEDVLLKIEFIDGGTSASILK